VTAHSGSGLRDGGREPGPPDQVARADLVRLGLPVLPVPPALPGEPVPAGAGRDSGTGVARVPGPAGGSPDMDGHYLPGVSARETAGGVRTPLALRELEGLDPLSYMRLRDCVGILAERYQAACEVEFVVEHGTLWLLGARVGGAAPVVTGAQPSPRVPVRRPAWASPG
jgi:hypothetical protein